jgi:predicted Fe-Mo cluster-binding NifX family protein
VATAFCLRSSRREEAHFSKTPIQHWRSPSCLEPSPFGFGEVLIAGTALAIKAVVTIAMPISQERISPLLDAAARLLLVTCWRGKEVARKEFVLGPLSPAELARSVAELHVDMLLCAALSQGLHRELERRGVRVQPHLCGDTEAVLQAFRCDRLNQPEFRMPGCCGPHLRANCCRPHRTARLLKTVFKPTKKSLGLCT